MHRVYEIFEVLPNGSPRSVTAVSGLEFAKMVLEGVAKRSSNECFVSDTKTCQVVMQVNVPRLKWRGAKHIFQIAYDEEAALRRAELLRACGFEVVSVIGNEAAKVALGATQDYDFFIVGHAAREETRREIVDRLKTKLPAIKTLAMNPPDQQILGADFNVTESDPERWLRVAAQQLVNSVPSLNTSSSSVA
jgi:hypothetical protein